MHKPHFSVVVVFIFQKTPFYFNGWLFFIFWCRLVPFSLVAVWISRCFLYGPHFLLVSTWSNSFIMHYNFERILKHCCVVRFRSYHIVCNERIGGIICCATHFVSTESLILYPLSIFVWQFSFHIAPVVVCAFYLTHFYYRNYKNEPRQTECYKWESVNDAYRGSEWGRERMPIVMELIIKREWKGENRKEMR